MALRADYLVVKVQQHSSGTTNEVIAETTDCQIASSTEFLETTSQDDGLNRSGIAGKHSHTVSGTFFMESAGTNYTQLWDHKHAGDVVEVEIERNGTNIHTGEGVITNLTSTGGTSAGLVTVAYTIEISGDFDAA